MTIIYEKSSNDKIDIVACTGELTGNCAIELQSYLYSCLDKGRRYQLINLKGVQIIDGLGLKVLCDFGSKGIEIRFFNLGIRIKMFLRMSGEYDKFNVYDETDVEKAVLLFLKEILGKKGDISDMKNRQHKRVSTDFAVEFKYNPGHNGVISDRARVLNLSEGGLLAEHIVEMNTKNGKILNRPEISGQELYDLRFRLDKESETIKTKGECVREDIAIERLRSGIRFKDMNHHNREMIRGYIRNII